MVPCFKDPLYNMDKCFWTLKKLYRIAVHIEFILTFSAWVHVCHFTPGKIFKDYEELRDEQKSILLI